MVKNIKAGKEALLLLDRAIVLLDEAQIIVVAAQVDLARQRLIEFLAGQGSILDGSVDEDSEEKFN